MFTVYWASKLYNALGCYKTMEGNAEGDHLDPDAAYLGTDHVTYSSGWCYLIRHFTAVIQKLHEKS